MLNGKFYTGLTPKMENRQNTSTINRQESHFFWPDDTDTESAVETRVKRRSSLSIPAAQRPFVQRQSSAAASDSDVDTKQMLHKEFAKSSIQFFDNIREEDETAPEQRRRPLLRSGKQEITSKPTATRYELPNNNDTTDIAAIKNKHVYESKVEFFDYADDDRNKRNNERRAKIDMNDKRDVERNTKNSPKLQNKRNVNNYIEDQYNNNKQETVENGFNEQHSSSKPRLRAGGIEFRDDVEEIDDNNLRKSRAKAFETKSRYNKYRRDQTPKRILKNTVRNGIDYSDYPECRDEDLYNEAVDYMAQTMKNARINGRRAPPRKQVTYSEEEEEIPVRNNNFKTNNDEDDLHYRKETNQSKYRNAQGARSNAGSNRRQHRETFSSDHSDLDQDQYMELKNTNKNNNNNNNNIKLSNETTDSLDESTKKSTTFTVPTNNSNTESAAESKYNRAHKHLRSSLCFNDGEIVASDIDSTSTALHQQRRNARNAATRRVSVGLPD